MTILILEPDLKTRSFLESGFRDEGYGVLQADTPDDALKAATLLTLKAIIMETILPSGSGFDLCSTMRSYGVSTPIVFLSSQSDVDHRIKGLRQGGDDYLTKPFSFEELLARIEAIGRRGKRYDERRVKLRVDDLVFDRETLNVKRTDRSIELTSKELSILELFMSEPGKVFSRARILSNVWGAGADPSSNIVDVYIGKLRRKIDGPGEKALIDTIRRRGYRILDLPPRAAGGSRT